MVESRLPDGSGPVRRVAGDGAQAIEGVTWMRWLTVAALTVFAVLAARAPDRITAQVVPAFVVSGTDARVLFAGYGALPAAWHSPGFDDSPWAPAQPASHRDYLTPSLEAPFAGSGAAWPEAAKPLFSGCGRVLR